MIGQTLGPYIVLAKVGAGGMGEVYRARDTRLDRSVAIKVLAPAVAHDAERRSRFEREAKAIAALTHPHICTLYDVGQHAGAAYLVMELVDGQTLATRLEKGALPLPEALTIAGQVADALAAAHRLGIVHRDIKPANIMLSKGGVKLLDFGLAKLRPTTSPVALGPGSQTGTATATGTAEGTILGTIHYMAPEQVEGKDADHRADIWALGAVLYEMVTGVRPFTGDTAASVVGAILKDTPPAVSTRQILSPPALDRVVATCLDKDQDDRWQSARDVAREIRWITSAGSPSAQPVATRRPRQWLMPAAAGAVVAGVLGAWGGSALRAPSPAAVMADAPPVIFTIEPPPGTALGEREASTSVPQLSVSPDGRHVVFTLVDARGQAQLWLRSLATTELRPLAGTDDAMDPFWSPDSRYVGFIARGQLKVVDTTSDVAPVRTLSPATVDPRGATWGAGGIVVYTGSPTDMQLVSPDGGPTKDIRVGAAVGPARWPEFLPDGRHLLLQIRSPDPALRGIYLRSLDAPAGEATRLVGSDHSARAASGQLLFVDGGTLMAQALDAVKGVVLGTPKPVVRGVGASSNGGSAFSVSNTGVLAYAGQRSLVGELRWVDRTGQVGPVVAPVADYVDFRFSNDQTRLVMARPDSPQSTFHDIHILDLARGTTTRLTSDRLTEASAVWSPDDQQLVFRSNRGTSSNDLYVTSSTPGGQARLLYDGAGASSTTLPSFWLKDGTVVFYQVAQSSAANGYGIWTMSAEGGEARALLDTPANELQAALSPDGRWMAYTSDQSGRYEIFVQDFPAGATRTLVSTNGGMQPRWRADGRELFYLQSDGSLMSVATTSGPRFDAAAPALLFHVRQSVVFNPFRTNYAPAADGKRFLMKITTEAARPAGITVILNWPALLEK